MRQLLEYTSFNFSKLSKHELECNVMTNEEVIFLIKTSFNFNTIINNPQELTKQILGKNKGDEKDIKIIIDPNNKYGLEKSKDVIKKIKNKMKKYTHFTLLDFIISNYNEVKNEFLKKQENLNNKMKRVEKELEEITNQINNFSELEEIKEKNIRLINLKQIYGL